jgi:uncharacterized iron-regulated membrane protein
MNTVAEVSTEANSKQYKRFWRWHFYAAFLVIPFILWQGVTGVIYLWHEELTDILWPELRFVNAVGAKQSLDVQLIEVMASRNGAMPKMIKLSSEKNRSTQFVFEESNGLSSPSFMDPYSGQLLGRVSSTAWLPGLTRELHGGWPLGKPGSWLLELGACWCIIMVLTGLYLWWPRNSRGLAGVLYPRFKAGRRIFWKDIHAVIGMWFSVFFLAFLVTALPWTDVWGNYLLKPLQAMSGQTAPAALSLSHNDHAHAMASHQHDMHLQQALESARHEGLKGNLEIRLTPGDAPIMIALKAGRAANERVLQVDRDSGEVLARVNWNDYPMVPKMVSTGVDLHEGTFFGPANQLFNSLVVFALFWLVITGSIGWYQRRPGKGLSAPLAMQKPWPRWLKYLAVALCILMPLLGVSVLSLCLLDYLLDLIKPKKHGVDGTGTS